MDDDLHSSLQFTGKDKLLEDLRFETQIVKAGYRGHEWTTDPLGRSIVNPPVWHASTVTYPNTAAFKEGVKRGGLVYGRLGTPTSWALEEAFSVLEGADNACAVSSGVAAITVSLLAFLKSGDHLLVSDGVYEPARNFCSGFLKRFGCETTFFDPCISTENFENLMKSNTRVVYMENPSSLSFELHDFEPLCKIAKSKNATVIVDNTYGPGIFKPLKLGADVSINAATKYIGGHSDLVLGMIGCRDHATYSTVRASVKDFGCPPGPDDCFLALRGMRTLALRMKRHNDSSLAVARWLEARPEVARVLHPGLLSHPQHALWRRDFSGCNGLFTIQLQECYTEEAVSAFVDALRLFHLGFSWGGYESLVLPVDVAAVRTAVPWPRPDAPAAAGGGAALRLHVGLEDPEDLLADLDRALAALAVASAAAPTTGHQAVGVGKGAQKGGGGDTAAGEAEGGEESPTAGRDDGGLTDSERSTVCVGECAACAGRFGSARRPPSESVERGGQEGGLREEENDSVGTPPSGLGPAGGDGCAAAEVARAHTHAHGACNSAVPAENLEGLAAAGVGRGFAGECGKRRGCQAVGEWEGGLPAAVAAKRRRADGGELE